jgi:hypothetical protein
MQRRGRVSPGHAGHLTVRRHHAGHVDVFRDRLLVAGQDCSPDALVSLVSDDFDPLVSRPRTVGGGVPRGVVDHDDPIDEGGNAGDCGADESFLVVGGHDDGHGLTVEHGARLYP